MAVNVWGLVAVVVFYVVILVVGLIAGRRQLMKKHKANITEVMLAGRDIGMVVGIFTMTATWVGGGYINGTAEMVYSAVNHEGPGLVWAQAPVGFSISLLIGGAFYAKKMREAEYMTMIDPFQKRLGDWMGALLVLPAICGETFWSAAILSALGSTLSVIIDLQMWISVIVSAGVALLYVLFGGLASVVYTDVIQLGCIAVGLVLAIPFAYNHEAVDSISITSDNTTGNWLGYVEGHSWGNFIDSYILLILGGIPWQVYFQRVLASKTPKSAQILSFCGGIGCLVFSIPPVLIGAIGYSTDWTQTAYNETLAKNGGQLDARFILPLVLQHLTPTPVAIIGLGAVAAAVMSSADSSMVSSSTMISQNVYKTVFRPKATDRETIWIMRISALVLCVIATVMAITIPSIYGLFVLCGDLVYVLLFPQITCTLFVPFFNTFGSFLGFLTSLILRCIGGESLLNWPALVAYPMYDETTKTQHFPFRTLAMLFGLVVMLGVSYLTDSLMRSGRLDRKWLKRVNNRLDSDEKDSYSEKMESVDERLEFEIPLSEDIKLSTAT